MLRRLRLLMFVGSLKDVAVRSIAVMTRSRWCVPDLVVSSWIEVVVAYFFVLVSLARARRSALIRAIALASDRLTSLSRRSSQ
jgi:hypothetical protein